MSDKKEGDNKRTTSTQTNNTEIEVNVSSISRKSDREFVSGLLMGAGMSESGTSVQCDPNAIHSNALQFEDQFQGLYETSQGTAVAFIQPPFDPQTLEKLVKHNNALGPCIEAMKINIDGTGFEIIKSDEDEDEGTDEDDEEGDKDKDKEKDKNIETLTDFFNQPWPGCSFTKLRKDLRQDLESVGYGFLEVIRDAKGAIVFLRHIESKTMRLIRLDKCHTVTREIIRGGATMSTKVNMRFRRFAQKIGTGVTYFKEFQADSDLDKDTGMWATADNNGKPTKLPFAKRASEIIYFTIDKDINTPYGVPRWIAQLPSVLGSRSAEETNLDFFDSGGIPPFILIVEGGILAPETRQAIEQGLSSNNDTKQRGLVIEAHSSSGSIDDNGKVKVQVERFGGEKQKDSTFENYDDKCEIRTRGSFRLPPIFVGRTGEYNFASAFASYMVGEAQVFKPERDEFDELMTLRLIPELIGKTEDTYKFRSLPIVVNDAKEKIMAVKTSADKKAITPKEMVRNLNEITGLEMKVDQAAKVIADTLDDDNEGITSDSELTDASTSDPNGPQGTSDNKQ